MHVYFVRASASRLFASKSPTTNRHLHEVSLKIALLFLGLFAGVSKSFASDTTATDGDKKETLIIHGKVLDGSKKPVAGVTVDFRSPLSDFGGANAKTAADGSFSISFRALAELNTYGVRLEAKSNDSDQMGVTRLKGPSIKQACETEQLIELVPLKSIKLKVTDAENKPIEGAYCIVGGDSLIEFPATSDATGTAEFRIPGDVPIRYVAAWMDKKGFDFRHYVLSRRQQADANAKPPEFPASGAETLTLAGAVPLTIRVVDDQRQPVAGVRVTPWLLQKPSESDEFNLSLMNRELHAMTDSEGKAVFDWIPNWQKVALPFWLTADGFDRTRASYQPETNKGMLDVVMERLVPIRGTVKHADGTSASSISIVASGGGHLLDGARTGTVTDKNGNYELKVPPEQIYIIAVVDKKWGAEPFDGFVVRRGQSLERRDFVLRPATRVHGQLIDETTKKPLPGQIIEVYQYGKRLSDLPGVTLANPTDFRFLTDPMICRSVQTDAKGFFELPVGSGSFAIFLRDNNKWERFEITSEPAREFTLTTRTSKKSKMGGTVVSGEPARPVGGAIIKGTSRTVSHVEWTAVTTKDGAFQVDIVPTALVIQAISNDQRFGAVVDQAADQLNITIPLKPLGSVHGRLVEPKTGAAVPNELIEYGIQVENEDGTHTDRFGGKVKTGADGTFHIEQLVQNREYRIKHPSDFDKSGQPYTWMPLRGFTLNSDGTTDLGDVILKPVPKPYVPPTLDERIATAFDVPKTPLDRFGKAKETAKLVDQRLVLLFGDPADPFVRDLMKVRFEDDSYTAISSDFLIAAIPTDPKRLPAAKELASSIQESLDTDHGKCLLVVFNSAGTKLKAVDGHALSVEGAFSKDKFIAELKGLAPTPRDGQKLLDDALAKAKAENKRVVVQETATWCGPCHRFSHFMDANRLWEKDFIWVRMDHRWIGAKEIMEEIRDGDKGGIPWIAILDSDGKVLARSNPGKEMCPPRIEENSWHFEQMIKSTSQRLSRDEIAAWIKGLGESEK